MASRGARAQPTWPVRLGRWLGTRLARCRRWFGFDRNPLRRRTDRIEAAIRLAMVGLVVVAVPITAIAVGRWADDLALSHARAQAAREHVVTAVLLHQAPATGVPNPYTSVQQAWTPARWRPPGQPARTGQVLANVGARAGSTMQIWIDASGNVTDPPLDPRTIAGDVCIAVMLTCMVSWVMLLGSQTLAHRAIERRRIRAWDAEWRATGPLWTGHRG